MKKTKTLQKMAKTQKAVSKFILQTFKNYQTMKKTISKIWLCLILASMACLSSCNVTRQITNESQYYQRGDTSVVIQTKTIETYNAEKK